MAKDNVDVIEASWEAFRKGDLDAAVSVAAEGAQIRVPDSLPFGGTYHGPDGFRDYVDAAMGAFDDFKVSPEKVLGADDDHVIVIAQASARGRAERFEWRVAWVYRLRDGKVVEAEVFADTARVIAGLGSS